MWLNQQLGGLEQPTLVGAFGKFFGNRMLANIFEKAFVMFVAKSIETEQGGWCAFVRVM